MIQLLTEAEVLQHLESQDRCRTTVVGSELFKTRDASTELFSVMYCRPWTELPRWNQDKSSVEKWMKTFMIYHLYPEQAVLQLNWILRFRDYFSERGWECINLRDSEDWCICQDALIENGFQKSIHYNNGMSWIKPDVTAFK